jgi:putative nucleotidyltransferase with HDIG domain
MIRVSKVDLLVLAAVVAASGSMIISYTVAPTFPGYWEVGIFILIAFLLDKTGIPLRVSARGSVSFVMHISSAMLFGAFWGGVVAGASVGINHALAGTARKKTVFNVAPRVISVTVSLLVYRAIGGSVPPAYLGGGFSTLLVTDVQRDVGLFFVFAALYFLINSALVSIAVAFSSDRQFRDVWSLNTRGILGYDIGASVMAMGVAWAYAYALRAWGFGPYGLFFVIPPIIMVRYVYGLYHQLQHSGQELLQLMVKAIEARDPYTSGHSVRVSEAARLIALELGLSVREVEQVETAALLHDVGKIHEEFAPLLRKEARLTPEETALMQTHSTRSAELVGVISKFRGFVQDSVRHHHERWDGQGYPSGLASKSIPLGSRIILICDTVDAMTTDRPYRKRLGLDVVIAELQKCRGTQFDPELVDLVIGSVAIRRMIAGNTALADVAADQPQRSRRVAWPAPSFWRTTRKA